MKCQFPVNATYICFDKYEQACLVCVGYIKHKRAASVFAARSFRNWTLTCSMYVFPCSTQPMYERKTQQNLNIKIQDF